MNTSILFTANYLQWITNLWMWKGKKIDANLADYNSTLRMWTSVLWHCGVQHTVET
jgi:hypothetical protein